MVKMHVLMSIEGGGCFIKIQQAVVLLSFHLHLGGCIVTFASLSNVNRDDYKQIKQMKTRHRKVKKGKEK